MPTKRIKHLSAVGFMLAIGLVATSGAASAPATGSQLAANSARASPKIAFIREPPFAGYAGVLWVMNPDGSGQRSLAPAFPGMRWSPDGQKVAFAAIVVQPDRLTSDIYVMNADGSGQRELTPDDAREEVSGLVARRTEDRFLSSGIRVVNADGSGLRRLTHEGWGDSLLHGLPTGGRSRSSVGVTATWRSTS